MSTISGEVHSFSVYKDSIESNINAYDLGAFLGVLVGDAAGAPLEFFRGRIEERHVLDAMKMIGGGTMSIGPGQITDDGELTLSLAWALVYTNPQKGLPIENIARMYTEWFDSRPFDVGNTCRRAFMRHKNEANENVVSEMMQRSVKDSSGMESNGALMRIVPLAIWCREQPVHVIAQNARMDALLSHPSQVCQDCNALYCIAVSELIRTGSKLGMSTKERVYSVLSTIDEFLNGYHSLSNSVHLKVREWYLLSKEYADKHSIDDLHCTMNIGHVKYAFILAFYHLRKMSSYEDAIKETLLKGGDTDTNAAIVGGMIGALHGNKGIPEYMLKPVLEFDCSKFLRHNELGYMRPKRYSASQALKLCAGLTQHTGSDASDTIQVIKS